MSTDVKVENGSGVNVDGLKRLVKPYVGIVMLGAIGRLVLRFRSRRVRGCGRGGDGVRDGVCVGNVTGSGGCFGFASEMEGS